GCAAQRRGDVLPRAVGDARVTRAVLEPVDLTAFQFEDRREPAKACGRLAAHAGSFARRAACRHFTSVSIDRRESIALRASSAHARRSPPRTSASAAAALMMTAGSAGCFSPESR